jgi:RNA polymerase sigma-70 factor (ECF subfamily)
MKVGPLKDKILYLRLKRKDKEAFIKAYDLYIDNIYRFVFFKVNNKEEAEDITSSVFLKSWDYIQSSELIDYKTLKYLLYKVARNLVIDHYRKRSKQQKVIYDKDISNFDIVDKSQDIIGQAELAADFKFIEKKLFDLKDEYREVIILRYLNELSIAEIADILEKSTGNIRVLLFRALKALREVINQGK